ncbi:hypothetical protein D920_00023 [Enterococcus faecalis 13-SD-W-01]|nr:hypothetical protein D920_00023 [Enterococcus faecalis 13-SD-W-01]
MSNNVLELRGNRFVQAAKVNNRPVPNMNSKKTVTSIELDKLSKKIQEIKKFWAGEQRPFKGVLVSVHYNKIAAKSNRISGLLKAYESNQAIVGAKFNEKKNKHIITYYVENRDLEKTILLLDEARKILVSYFDGRIDKAGFDNNSFINRIPFNKYAISKSAFKAVIGDVSYIDDFEVEMSTAQTKESIITLYDTKMSTQKLLKDLGIDILSSRIIDNQTVFLNEHELGLLREKAPYLIAMATTDLSQLAPSDFSDSFESQMVTIPEPSNEPTIGVIDTLFDKRVYFGSWVDYHDMVSEHFQKEAKDYNHGTAVSSLIVDGPRLNPWLDDGCGRFKVRHFGVAAGGNFSSYTIIRMIKQVIASNPDIKVWNISLGSNQEINDNFISAEAAVLDQIQFEHDVIFVIAGTNKPSPDVTKIGSPADSINGIVVNSVTKSGLSTTYTRQGIALSFFAKPDVSYYGGSKEEFIRVCEPLGESKVAGTSFAAPWIARKLSYMIDVLGISREIAKAMLIDAAKGWNDNPTPEYIAVFGHGTVPIKIDDIVKTPDDEIRFLVTDISEKWNTYNYSFPIPLHENKYPYIARATMCYFPICNRAQGVDYTNTELNLHFGRIQDNGKIKDIKGDKQNSDASDYEEGSVIFEAEARESFRKWDNVKYLAEKPGGSKRPRRSYSNKNWGMEIKTSNRLDPKDGIGLRFGVVVTLKEINGINRIDEFIRNCNLSGWIVNELDVAIRQDIQQKLNEDIEFD